MTTQNTVQSFYKIHSPSSVFVNWGDTISSADLDGDGINDLDCVL